MNFFKSFVIACLIMCAAVCVARAQVAQGGTFALTQTVVADGGGMNATGNVYSLSGTIGQPAAGAITSGSTFELSGGFWTPETANASLSADLSVVKTAAPNTSINAGDNIVYTINFTNNSASNNAGDVTVTDPLPANTTFVSATITTGTSWTTTAPAVGGTGNVVFSKASVSMSETAQFQVVVKVDNGTASGVVISNTAQVASSTSDPDVSNNNSTATTTVGCSAATPGITATPSSVVANSAGNAVSTTAVATSYAWTISNGSITSTSNAQSITYSAGTSGNVTLTLSIIDSNGCTASNSIVVPITSTQPVVAAGSILISEFRTRGENGADDEFVELYNNTDSAINIGGFVLRVKEGGSVVAPSTLVIMQSGATIPARGHYLLRKAGASNYSLAAYAEADQTYSGSLDDNIGIAFFSSSTVFDATTLLDAVGFDSVTDPLYKKGTGLAPATGITEDGQYSFVRKVSLTGLRNTADNNSDFVFVSNIAGIFSGKTSILGAPGPENALSPVPRSNQFGVQLIEPNATSTAAPNRVRNSAQSNLFETPNVGTLEFRRRWVNNTGRTVTRMRFRLVDVTTLNTPSMFASQADLRAISSGDFSVSTSRGTLAIKGLTLEAPSNQGTSGGGLNSSFVVTLPPGGLAPSEALNVNFLVGVKTSGSFRFDIFIEALP